MTSKQQLVSAQVILYPADRATGQEHVSAKNVAAHLPDKSDAALAIQTFVELGFDTGALAGTSFSITAPASLFEKTFSVKLIAGEKMMLAEWKDNIIRDHLPPDAGPGKTAEIIKAIVLPLPPAFGPGSY